MTSPFDNESSSNSSDEALLASATFTGDGERNLAPDVMVSCQTDVAGTLYFDFSVDGTNWGAFPVNGFAVAAGIHEFHTAVKGPRWFRVRLVNGSSNQGYLRLHTYYGAFRQPNAPLNQSIGADADALIVRTVDSKLDLELGRFSGMQSRRKFGYATGLGTAIQLGTPSTWVDLWNSGGLRTSPTSSFTPYMASSSASDTDVDVTWTYLDANGEEQTVEVNTNGQTGVSLGVTATEVYRGYVSGGTACVGTVHCASANNFTSGVPTNQSERLAAINANDQQTQVLAFRVPSNKLAILNFLTILISRASGAAGSADISLDIRESGGVFRSIFPMQINTGGPLSFPLSGVLLAASTDVRLRIRDVSDASTAIAGDLDYYLVDA